MHVWHLREYPRGGQTVLKTCGSKRTHECVVASGSLNGKILQKEVVEDFESRPGDKNDVKKTG